MRGRDHRWCAGGNRCRHPCTALAGLLLVVMAALAVDTRRWTRLAARSGVGARSEGQVRRVLGGLEAEGWRVRRSLPWGRPGDVDSVAIAPTGIGFAIETKTRMFDARHLAHARQTARGFTGIAGVGVGEERSRCCAWCVPAGWRGSRTGFLWSRLIA